VEEILKAIAALGPSVAKYIFACLVAIIVFGLLYDRLIRGETGPPARDVAPMIGLGGIVVFALSRCLLRKLQNWRRSK
jgi:hypothetical protein